MPPKPKTSPESSILAVLSSKNRPFSAITLCDELHGEYSQSAVKKAAEQLAETGAISAKISGKTKLFFPNQANLVVATPMELASLDRRLEQLSEACSRLKERAEVLRSQRDALLRKKTICELRKFREEVEKKAVQEEQRKSLLIEQAKGITPEDAQNYTRNFAMRCEQWRRRKNMCKEIIDQISEGCNKKPSELIDELGLETDEALGLKLEFKNKVYTVIEDNA